MDQTRCTADRVWPGDGTLLPGLVDAHAHQGFDARPAAAPRTAAGGTRARPALGDRAAPTGTGDPGGERNPEMTESAQGRPPVDETRPSAPSESQGSGRTPDPSGTGVGMGLGEADSFEPEESAPADEDADPEQG
ncbi:hypothetical protein DQ238_14420 [Geodermatophilus sp. TF02-6]|uniref:hypothetical protein n=1 Tax=Geodermatophilus sp. TF02-6 TaxID=2250575 RepID=UPI000DE82EB4|nr:hypothetical protein [Geodermatophilus sp. TF02-6]RBY77606.1 hypothetical protein DQ238_14420 [Geodermatophilus sp. TF02-6]